MKRSIISSLALAAAAFAFGQSNQNLVITDTEDNNSYFPASELDMVIFQPVPDYMKLPVYVGGSYVETSTLGEYRVEFCTEEPAPDGMPSSKGGMTVSLLLIAPWTDDITAPELPTGYYRLGNSSTEYTFDAVRSAIYYRAAVGEDVTPMMIIDGTVDVRREGSKYDIRIEATTMEGFSGDFRYEGEIELPVGAGEFTPFTESLDITFDGAQGRFYGNWFYPFSADLFAQLWAGDLSPEGYLVDGYVLYLDFNEPKPENEMDPSPRIADGVYTAENREGFAYTYLPFRFNKGAKIDFLGQTVITKTRLEYIGSDGSRKLGLITGGSFTVSDNGSKLTFDFITQEGISIKGSYTGVPNIVNFCDNDEKAPKRPYSTIEENVELDFISGTLAMSYNEGPSILDDLNTLTLMVTVPAMDKGDFIMIDLLSKEEIVSDGTYTMTWDLGENHMIPGTIDYGRQMLFSWYGDLDTTDDEGYQSALACLEAGTMTISTNSDGTKKIMFDLTDDNGYKITGEYNGVLVNLNDYEDSASVRMSKRAPRKVRVTNIEK